MTNENTQQELVIPSTAEVLANKEALQNVKNKAKSLGEQADADFIEYLKLSKEGEWVHGEKEEEVDEDDEFIIHPLSYQYGAVAFADNEFVDEKLVSAFGNDPIPVPEDLEKEFPIDKVQANDGWKAQHGIMLMNVKGGPRIVYKTSSVGGIRALERLIGEVGKRMETNQDSFFPRVKLDVSFYKHKKYGKIYTPVLKIVAWMKNDSADIADIVEEDEAA